MAVITKSIEQHHRLVANLVPVDILKQIDQGELLDRVTYAEELSRKAQSAADVTLRRGYAKLAQAVLRAQPRALTERQGATLIAKAAGVPNTSQADAIRRQEQELRERHPVAPRREDAAAVVKAKADDAQMVVCYDAAGNAFGVCDAADIQAVGTAADVAKARLGKARRAVQVTGRPAGRR
jgi:hypothetical protein